MTSRSRRPRHRAPTRSALPRAVVATLAVAAGVAAHLAAGGGAAPLPVAAGVTPPAASMEARTVLERSRPVSRDSAREALAEATGRPLTAPRTGQARQEDGGLAELAARAEEEAASLARAWVLPLGPGYRLTAGFGECSSLWARCHTGLDLAAPSGTPLRAVAGGTITEVGWAGPYGNRTVQTLEDGTELWYCHQETIGVRLGDEVTAGQEIGRVGSTGNTTGPHLHLEVRPGAGDPVDPAAALTAHGATP